MSVKLGEIVHFNSNRVLFCNENFIFDRFIHDTCRQIRYTRKRSSFLKSGLVIMYNYTVHKVTGPSKNVRFLHLIFPPTNKCAWSVQRILNMHEGDYNTCRHILYNREGSYSCNNTYTLFRFLFLVQGGYKGHQIW